MNINWFEIIAQMINFFILLFILHKLFYKPVIKSMEGRQQRIRDKQDEADEKMKKADELIALYERKTKELENNKEKQLEEASNKADEKREALIATYKEEAEEKRRDYMNEVEEEQEHFMQEVRTILGKNAVKIAAHILEMISGDDLDNKSFDAFMEKVRSLDRETLHEEAETGEERILMISSKIMAKDQKETLEEVLREKLDTFRGIDYQVDEELIHGYELKLETLTVHTNIKKYVQESEKQVLQTLEKSSS